jgi:hypothetical protein
MQWLVRRPRNIVFGALGLFVLIQLVPVWLTQTNPPAHAEPPWDSAATRSLVQRSCFDCHTNYTVWPAYSRVAPVSWLVTFDVFRGRRHLNFSQWSAGPADSALLTRAIAAIRSGDMPPRYYVLMHPRAALSAREKQHLIAGLQRSLH